MKKIMLIIILLSFIGCSKDDDINPSTVYNGKWEVVGIEHNFPTVNGNLNSKITISTPDYGCIGSYDIKETLSNGNLVLSQDPSKFIIGRRFIKNATILEFDKGNVYKSSQGVIESYIHNIRLYENNMFVGPKNGGSFLGQFTIFTCNMVMDYNNEKTIFAYVVDPGNKTMILYFKDYPSKVGSTHIVSQLTITLRRL